MIVILDFVHRNGDYDLMSYADDRPLQLIRPMPDKLRDYVTAKDYEEFCIQSIDPLLVALHETEKTKNRWRIGISIILVILLLYAGISYFLTGDFDIELAIWGAGCFVVLILISICVDCNFTGKIIKGEIRTECEKMSYRCSAHSKSNTILFELVMKRVLESSDENGTYFTRKVSHINVTISDKKSYDLDYKLFPLC